MSSTCNCIAGAMKAIKSSSLLRLELQGTRTSVRRTLSSHSPNTAVLSRTVASGSASHFRTLQSSSVPCRSPAGSLRKPFCQARSFSNSTARCKLRTIEQVKARNKGGPFNLAAALLFVATGGALYAYFTYEKQRMDRKRIAEETKGIGKPKVGGPFDLVDHDGNRFTSDDMHGKYALVYFGFTHCPDICPDELDKMAIMYDKVVERCGKVLLPLMITCDPARDTPEVLKEYLKEFHPEIIGLTGEYENIKQTCKAYRVYFSTPPNVKPGQDYLVDHSIYFYLMDPDGDFVEAIGRNFTAEQAAKLIGDHIKDWSGPLNKKDRWA